MKRYILTGMVLLVVGATASENPFDLKENFGQLEQDQEVLLSELKKISDLQELAEEKKLVGKEAKELANIEAEIELPKEDLSIVENDDIVTSLDTESNNIAKQVDEGWKQELLPQDYAVPSEENLSVMGQKALDISKPESIKKETLKQEAVEKEAVEKYVQSKEAELKKAKQEASTVAEAKKEAEKREVEAYEKKRAERLAGKTAEVATLEKETLVQKVVKVKALAEATETDSEQVSEAPTAKKQTVTVKNKIDMGKSEDQTKQTVKVIDAKREKEDAKIVADKAYEEAVKEMNQEEAISS